MGTLMPHHLQCKAVILTTFLFTENKRSSIWELCRHWWHRKLSKWQLTVPPVTTKLSNWRPFVFSVSVLTTRSFNLQISCRDLTSPQGTRIAANLAAKWHTPSALLHKTNIFRIQIILASICSTNELPSLAALEVVTTNSGKIRENKAVNTTIIDCVWSPKRKCRFETIVTGCTWGCHFDKFRCIQWRKFHQNDSIRVSGVSFTDLSFDLPGGSSSWSQVHSRHRLRPSSVYFGSACVVTKHNAGTAKNAWYMLKASNDVSIQEALLNWK